MTANQTPTPNPSPLERGKAAFTLAEVLITLGIIGIVASITLPAIIQNYQQRVLKQQFKKSYSILQNALLKVEADLGYKPECYYWTKNPYGSSKCVSYSDDGFCSKYELASGGDLPSDYNGNFGECTKLKTQMEKTLVVVKKCVGNALENKCIPGYKGNDTIYAELHEGLDDYEIKKAISGCRGWKQTNINETREVWNLADGTIILFYISFQLFAVDVNGKKGPNKWGYDLFPFLLKSNYSLPLKLYSGSCSITEKGGVSTSEMLKNLYK